MIKNDPQNPNTSPSHVESSSSEEGSNPDEEPDQRRQDVHMQHVLRDEKIRCVCIGVALLSLIVSFLIFFRTGTVLPLFVTMVVTSLGYRWLDRHLGTAERSRL